jgi:hypothetical protein
MTRICIVTNAKYGVIKAIKEGTRSSCSFFYIVLFKHEKTESNVTNVDAHNLVKIWFS